MDLFAICTYTVDAAAADILAVLDFVLYLIFGVSRAWCLYGSGVPILLSADLFRSFLQLLLQVPPPFVNLDAGGPDSLSKVAEGFTLPVRVFLKLLLQNYELFSFHAFPYLPVFFHLKLLLQLDLRTFLLVGLT